jgi:hypothetical protein
MLRKIRKDKKELDNTRSVVYNEIIVGMTPPKTDKVFITSSVQIFSEVKI